MFEGFNNGDSMGFGPVEVTHGLYGIFSSIGDR